MATWTVGSGKTYSTIQAALDALYVLTDSTNFTETQTIEVYNGTYTETITPNSSLKPTAAYRLIITNAAGNSPVVSGQSTRTYGFNTVTVPYVTVSGFTVKNTTSRAIYFNSSYVICSNNICYSNVAAILFSSSANSLVYNNTCYSNTGIGLTNASGSGSSFYNNNIYSNISYGMTSSGISNNIYNNIIRSNSLSGLYIGGVITGSNIYNNLIMFNTVNGIHSEGGTGGNIYNNTLYLNAGNGIRCSSGASNATVKNNIIWNSAGYCLRIDSQTGFVSDYNDLYVSGTGKVGYWGADQNTLALWKLASSQDANSISIDPLLMNAGGGADTDYRIITTSPCKNVALDLSAVFTTDYFGTTRPTGVGTWDIGMHEFVSNIRYIGLKPSIPAAYVKTADTTKVVWK